MWLHVTRPESIQARGPLFPSLSLSISFHDFSQAARPRSRYLYRRGIPVSLFVVLKQRVMASNPVGEDKQ